MVRLQCSLIGGQESRVCPTVDSCRGGELPSDRCELLCPSFGVIGRQPRRCRMGGSQTEAGSYAGRWLHAPTVHDNEVMTTLHASTPRGARDTGRQSCFLHRDEPFSPSSGAAAPYCARSIAGPLQRAPPRHPALIQGAPRTKTPHAVCQYRTGFLSPSTTASAPTRRFGILRGSGGRGFPPRRERVVDKMFVWVHFRGCRRRVYSSTQKDA